MSAAKKKAKPARAPKVPRQLWAVRYADGAVDTGPCEAPFTTQRAAKHAASFTSTATVHGPFVLAERKRER